MNRIGIRREDKNRWERRAPLTPEQVGRLVRDHGLAVTVERAPRRVFSDDVYREAGADLVDDLGDVDVVLAIKEIPVDRLRRWLVYVFFSHTAKGQESNRSLLRTILDLECTLVDYEKAVDDEGRRVFFFGREAGIVGAMESLRGLGLRLESRGIRTPLLDVRPTHAYDGMDEILPALDEIGDRIREDGLPAELGPVVVGITGDGQVSRGAREILERLPVREITPEELDALPATVDDPTREVLVVVFREPDMVAPVDPARPFDLQEYYDHPDLYRSILEPRLRRLTVLLHGSYWEPQYPRVLTRETVERWWGEESRPRLEIVGDISCDPDGGIEINRGVTTPDAPFYVYDPSNGQTVDGVAGDGPVVLAVDNLPCMLPRVASEGFGAALEPFIPGLAKADLSAETADAAGLPAPLRRAVIVWRGVLEPAYRHLEALLPVIAERTVLVLGAGFVAGPLVRYLLDRTDARVRVAALEGAEGLVAGHVRGEAVPLDATDESAVDRLIADADLVVSLLPPPFHPRVARMAIARGRPVVTTSYVGDEMRALDAPAREAGVVVLNEVGVDPGLDHMTALHAMNRIRAAGGRIDSFRSHCGGLPTPEASDNPFGYKFSWAPRGVLVAALRAAHYRWEGQEIIVPGGSLFEHVRTCDLGLDGLYETYPNADALTYGRLYGIEDARTIYRGTLRYPGHGKAWTVIVGSSLLDDRERDLAGMTWSHLLRDLTGLGPDEPLREGVAARFGLAPEDDPLERLAWLGLFEDEPLGLDRASPLDLFAARMLERMRYAPGERDLIVMRHEIGAVYPDRREAVTSTLLVRGEPHGDSAMARTVGLPAAVATRAVLEGRYDVPGVTIPTDPAFYEPVLEELEGLGIAVREESAAV